jgi:hypothetical protein
MTCENDLLLVTITILLQSQFFAMRLFPKRDSGNRIMTLEEVQLVEEKFCSFQAEVTQNFSNGEQKESHCKISSVCVLTI